MQTYLFKGDAEDMGQRANEGSAKMGKGVRGQCHQAGGTRSKLLILRWDIERPTELESGARGQPISCPA